ncbi:GntR family transcriptional regulator [Alkalihalobacillus macyae]|uniref:GntR family transcriptional regulator n=1 Tax=Guptibacillus hwajinpoensis TaxID=208199 RepID=UPI00273CEE59|nr:GntR family transcriptional regulator [Alkalihalobacillus macyae]MDP4552502.1 GntR family transcriptional regulator [Alkalihalobacillus macyae]
MGEEFNPSKPIYLQLVDRISWEIIKGERSTGEKLPSVRDMAIHSGVNPNTVSRTYNELERMGIVETKRGQGTFVTEHKDRLIELREQLKVTHIRNFIEEMKQMGFSSEDMVKGIRTYVNNEGENGK